MKCVPICARQTHACAQLTEDKPRPITLEIIKIKVSAKFMKTDLLVGQGQRGHAVAVAKGCLPAHKGPDPPPLA